MKKTWRFLSILIALVLSLSIAPALAQSPEALLGPAGTPRDIRTIRSDIQLSINPQAAAIISMLTGETQGGESDPAISTLINAINRLGFNVLANKNAISAVIGSQNAELMDVRAWMDPETYENHITTSVLPGLALSIDPAVIRNLTARASAMALDPERVLQLTDLHLQAVGGVLTETALSFPAEEGSFIVGGYGTFTKRTQVVLTTHMMADLLKRLGGIYSSAPVHMEYMQMILSQTNALIDEAGADGEVPDPGKQLSEAAETIKAEPDKAVASGWVYEGEDGVYIDAVTPEDAASPTRMHIFLGKKEIRAKIIGKGYSYTQGEEEHAAPEWERIEEDILAGENHTDILITLNGKHLSDLPQINTEAVIAIVANGTSMGLTINSDHNVESMESNASFSLSIMTPDPLMTLTVSTKPTEEQPEEPILGETRTILFSENELTDEENTLLETSLAQAIPALFSRIGAVLPEEGPLLMQMLGEMMAPQEAERPVEAPGLEEIPGASVPGEGELRVVTENLYVPDGGDTGYFFAKVENTGSDPIGTDYGSLTILGDNDNVLFTREYISSTQGTILLEPHEYAYVTEYLWDNALRENTVSSYTFSMGEQETAQKIVRVPCEAAFDLPGAQSYENYVNVTFTNTSDEPRNDFNITAALLDENSNLLLVQNENPTSIAIHPGSTVTIRIYVNSDMMAFYEAKGLVPAKVDAIVSYPLE